MIPPLGEGAQSASFAAMCGMGSWNIRIPLSDEPLRFALALPQWLLIVTHLLEGALLLGSLCAVGFVVLWFRELRASVSKALPR